MKCGACAEAINEQDKIQCITCKGNYHFYCGGFSEKAFRITEGRRNRWKCIKCQDTVQQASSTNPNSKTSAACATITNPEQDSSKQVSDMDILDIVAKFEKDSSDLKLFITEQFSDYTKNLEYHNSIVTDLKETIKDLKNEVQDVKKEAILIKTENTVLKNEIENLKSEITELQQYSRRSNLEISGLPEIENENINETVDKVLSSLDVSKPHNIIVSHRVPTSRKDRHKSIIVQFATKNQRDVCITAAKTKHLLASDINTRFDTSPIYVNEHLAPAVKKLLFQSKVFKKDNNFKFCWVKEGKVFLRKNENSRVYRIRKDTDLKEIQCD